MNKETLKYLVFITAMFVLFALTFSTKNPIDSKLYLSLAVICGAISFQNLITQKQTNNE